MNRRLVVYSGGIGDGIDQSIITLAEHVKLSQSIKNATINESSKFLVILGTAHFQKEVEDKVIKATKNNAVILSNDIGVQSTLTEEVKLYVYEAIHELKSKV